MTEGAEAAVESKADSGKLGHSPLFSEEAMLEAEGLFLWPKGAWPKGPPSFRAGLALSGGGIRAATVSLGVLQALAERGLLKQFHYLSTVSGGGYIGSALSWFWCKKRVDEENILSPSPTAPPLRFGADARDFPFQEDQAPGPAKDPRDPGVRAAGNLEFLRNHGSYLTSGDGIGFAGLIIAVVRTILLSLAVWLPLLVLAFGIFEVVDFFFVGPEAYQRCIQVGSVARGIFKSYQCRPSYVAPLMLAGSLVLAFLAGVVVFSFLSRFQLDSSNPGATSRRRYRPTLLYLVIAIASSTLTAWIYTSLDRVQPPMAVEILVLSLASLAFFMLAIAEFLGPDNAGYFLRRSFEKQSSKLLPIAIASLYIGALPWIVSNLKPATGASFGSLGALGPIGGAVTLLSGVGTALYGYYLKAKSILPGMAGQVFAIAGSILFLSGLLLFSFVLAGGIFAESVGFDPVRPAASAVRQEVSSAGEEISKAARIASQAASTAFRRLAAGDDTAAAPAQIESSDGETPWRRKLVILFFLPLVALAGLIGFFGSVNATGLHRFYRDRLMETFLPMANAVEKGTARESDVADNLSVADIVQDSVERGDRPYHLVNAHAILINDELDPKVALRGGDNFLISPAFVGSSATGWMRTRDYVSHHGALTLASAMAVSGAAANANAGYIGTGLTRDRFVSAVMSLLNIRLGLWVGNPKATARMAPATDPTSPAHDERRLARFRTKVATYFNPVLTCGIFGYGHHRDAPFLELSDGGHFENLGLYELIRRRLDLILVVDAEQDSNISLAALVSSTNRIKEDFGVSVGFLDSRGPEQLLGKDSDRYPSGARLARSPFVVAEIRYPAVTAIPGKRSTKPSKRGVLIYIKSTMVTGLAFATDGYKAANPEFPHQSTVDQFFDPDQFEAYRDLGKKSCEAMILSLDLGMNVTCSSRLLERYGFPAGEAATLPTSIAERDHDV
ncbi:patatin-like phospholipase family protein [Bradyrhizobium sp. SSUT77]|uniref:patatin-like phospholipase family protein n=1 Tax=Bradyrhizobium sp. SSUT77 TaxID=3040603 RepID=UPI002447A11F|nr:patatin-like phospholipase family protein [Bradyrhizobium sp. SSUT77]MDH2346381.1 patatin-like phospholipase family protein [Bradyrhizobium sp. SSUT77]